MWSSTSLVRLTFTVCTEIAIEYIYANTYRTKLHLTRSLRVKWFLSTKRRQLSVTHVHSFH